MEFAVRGLIDGDNRIAFLQRCIVGALAAPLLERAHFRPNLCNAVRRRAHVNATLAATAIGAGSIRIMLRHILPNVIASYIVLGTITLGFAIIIEASLSFLGVGVPPDIPTWGGMLTRGTEEIRIAWWLAVFPGIAISVVVFAINFLGDALRDALDPRLRGR